MRISAVAGRRSLERPYVTLTAVLAFDFGPLQSLSNELNLVQLTSSARILNKPSRW